MNLSPSFVYIITNRLNSVFYIGCTRNLSKRLEEHSKKYLSKSFSAKYNLYKLVFFESFQLYVDARSREKQLKNWRRRWKINLIKKDNPEFRDLSELLEAY